jgi:hypothetical protein
MVKISYAVMHASFDKNRRKLLDKFLSNCHFKIQIIEDEFRDGIWSTAQRAWLAHDLDSTHHIVLQDDFVLANNFNIGVHNLINLYPDKIFSLFQPATPLAATWINNIQNKHNFIEIPEGVVAWGGSVILPTKLIIPMISWANAFCNEKDWGYADDEKISAFCLQKNHKIYSTIPTLMQHVGYNESVMNHTTNDWRKGPDLNNLDAATINWSNFNPWTISKTEMKNQSDKLVQDDPSVLTIIDNPNHIFDKVFGAQ